MNVYGFEIESNKFPISSTYIVFANDEKEANDKIDKEFKIRLSEENGWRWGTPIVKTISEDEMRKLKNANIIW